MDDKVKRLIIAYSRINTPHIHTDIDGFNASETGVLWAIAQIALAHSDTKLFSLKELNSYLNYTKPNLSQTVNKLEDKGVVERTVLKNDRRVTYIRLTDQGLQMMNARKQCIVAKMEKVIQRIGEENIDAVINLFEKFTEALED
ncbi:MAG: MarR family transcriptional regulator [Eubacterium sp.]|nr:MarR family transcriptional regulator [Eubacterium sp.]